MYPSEQSSHDIIWSLVNLRHQLSNYGDDGDPSIKEAKEILNKAILSKIKAAFQPQTTTNIQGN